MRPAIIRTIIIRTIIIVCTISTIIICTIIVCTVIVYAISIIMVGLVVVPPIGIVIELLASQLKGNFFLFVIIGRGVARAMAAARPRCRDIDVGE